MKLQQILFSQGFGTRRQCSALIERGLVSVNGSLSRDVDENFATENLTITVEEAVWPYHEKAFIILNKPAGFECSHKPKAWPSVYSLLPTPLRQRPTKTATEGVQSIGRLDQDTTGLLILSDDGQFIHRMASPKYHMPKVYEVTTADAFDEAQCAQLLAGVVLNDDPDTVRAAACVATGTHSLKLTLTEGKYHQVKRMLAAVGNRVTQLHRSQIGGLCLPEDLPSGDWRWMSAEELALCQVKA